MKWVLIFLTLPFWACHSGNWNSQASENVIYGAGTRVDLYEVSDPSIVTRASSTVALMTNSKLISQGNGAVGLEGVNFAKGFNLCSSEPFTDQNSVAFCSGFLVTPDTILTAGHCMTSQRDCQNTRFVFGFSIYNSGINPSSIAADQVYECGELIYREENDDGADFALVRLNRTVIDHTPLALRQSGQIPLNDPLIVIGNPSGLPTKVASGSVQNISMKSYFVTNLDTYSGNSGSAVFNGNTGLVEGVLVRGGQDFVPSLDSPQSCQISNHCPEGGCQGEDVTRISEVLPYLMQETSISQQDIINDFVAEDLKEENQNVAGEAGVLHSRSKSNAE